MTRRKLNNPTKLRTEVSFERPESPPPANSQVLDLRAEQVPPVQEEAMDCSWKRPRLDEGSTTPNWPTVTNGVVRREPKSSTSRPSHPSSTGNNGTSSVLSATFLQTLMTQHRLPMVPASLPLDLAPGMEAAGNLNLNLVGDNKYMQQMPKPPSADMVKSEPLLMQAYHGMAMKALELGHLSATYEALVRNLHRKAVVVSSASSGTAPASNGVLAHHLNGGVTAPILAGLPSLQTSPSAGSGSPLNSPHFPTPANGTQTRTLAPAPRRLSGPPEAASQAGPSVAGTGALTVAVQAADREVTVRNGDPGTPAKRPPSAGRRRNDRRADSEMNEPNLRFMPDSFFDSESVEQVQLSSKEPSVTISREKYNEIIRKGESSATRVIRMIMKHFFVPEVLAVSSLSGTGQYKEVLNPTIVNAIKDFIGNRYPKLKSSRLNLCMTDVCVQARRVKSNQTRRSGTAAASEPEPEDASVSLVLAEASGMSSNSSNDGNPNDQDDLDLNVTAPSLPAAFNNRPLSPPSEGEGRLVIE